MLFRFSLFFFVIFGDFLAVLGDSIHFDATERGNFLFDATASFHPSVVLNYTSFAFRKTERQDTDSIPMYMDNVESRLLTAQDIPNLRLPLSWIILCRTCQIPLSGAEVVFFNLADMFGC